MILYRFSYPKFAGDLSGNGAKLCGGRWNPVGIAVTYSSGHISLALLEMLANTGTLEELQSVQLVEIDVPDHTGVQEIRLSGLKKNWQADFDYTQWMGQAILNAGKDLLVKCPSAIIPAEHNYLINPRHPDFKKIRVSVSKDFNFDRRLFKQHMG
jgi:RES domain-containing protein